VFLLVTVTYWLGMTLIQLYLNFYLQALGFDQGWIGAINAAPQITIVATTFLIGGVSRKLGAWRAMILGTTVAGIALILTATSGEAWQILLTSMLMGVGGGFVWSNSGPFLMKHSEEASRATLFSLQAALGTLTGFVAYLGGGILPAFFANLTGQPQDAVVVLRGVMLTACAFYFLSLVPLILARPRSDRAIDAAAPGDDKTAKSKRGFLPSDIGLVSRLLFPGSLVALGAGMTMPFMNLFVEKKFAVSFAALGQLFAWTSIATAVALLLQPVLANRVGKVTSVVIVQAASLPFLLVLGYADFFPLVAIALFVRAALMNMGNPVFSAYSMGRIREDDRATFASLASSTWSLGWAIGSWLSGMLRGTLGFETGFNLLFGLMAGLYATSTILMWLMFGREESATHPETREPAKIDDEATAAA
jgi:MFS family permease